MAAPLEFLGESLGEAARSFVILGPRQSTVSDGVARTKPRQCICTFIQWIALVARNPVDGNAIAIEMDPVAGHNQASCSTVCPLC